MSDDQIASIVQRVQRLQDEKKLIEDDIREVYQEARANGFDVKVLRAVVKHLGKDEDAVAEFDAIFDLYLSAVRNASSRADGAPRATRTHEATEYQPARSLAERDPQSAQHGSDRGGGAGGESRTYEARSEQESVVEPQSRNEPESVGAASGGAGVTARPETPIAKPYDPGPIPAFLDRRDKRDQLDA